MFIDIKSHLKPFESFRISQYTGMIYIFKNSTDYYPIYGIKFNNRQALYINKWNYVSYDN